MTGRPPIPALNRESRTVAIARHVSAMEAPRIGRALAGGGVLAMELTLNEPAPSRA